MRYAQSFGQAKSPALRGREQGLFVCVDYYGLNNVGIYKQEYLYLSVCNVHLSVGVVAVGGYDSEGVVKKFVELMTKVEAESSEIV